jgi:hypothetical protein
LESTQIKELSEFSHMEQKHRLKDIINSLQAIAVQMKFLESIRKQKRDKVRRYKGRKSTRIICETIRVKVWTCFNIWMRTLNIKSNGVE